MLFLSTSVLTSCLKFQEDAFDKPSSERVQELLDSTYATLTSSAEGWYFANFPGWDVTHTIGGYWFWCKFNADYTVEAMNELLYKFPAGYNPAQDPDKLVVPNFTESVSPFSIIKGRGVVISFDIYNEVLDIFSHPGSGTQTQGMQGDLEFQVVSVAPDKVTVKGIRTGKIFYFIRKSDGKEPSVVLNEAVKFSGEYVAPAWVAQVKGASTASATMSQRTFTISYLEDGAKEGATPTELLCPFTVSLTGKSIELFEPIEVLGNTITGFTYAYEDGDGVFTSNDANQTVKIAQMFPPLNKLFMDAIPTTSFNFIRESGKMSADLLAAFNTAGNTLSSNEGEDIYRASIGLGIHSSYRVPSISFACLPRGETRYYVATYQVVFSAVEDTDDEVMMVYDKPVGDGSYSGYLSIFLNPLVMPICNNAPYVITPDDPMNPVELKFTSKANPSFFFTISY
ncbi:MAG: DUF4302 domain-containing protein [Alistipes sp.]|nr:DUF4302 domain-containing protein [Alistipes sp.]